MATYPTYFNYELEKQIRKTREAVRGWAVEDPSFDAKGIEELIDYHMANLRETNGKASSHKLRGVEILVNSVFSVVETEAGFTDNRVPYLVELFNSERFKVFETDYGPRAAARIAEAIGFSRHATEIDPQAKAESLLKTYESDAFKTFAASFGIYREDTRALVVGDMAKGINLMDPFGHKTSLADKFLGILGLHSSNPDLIGDLASFSTLSAGPESTIQFSWAFAEAVCSPKYGSDPDKLLKIILDVKDFNRRNAYTPGGKASNSFSYMLLYDQDLDQTRFGIEVYQEFSTYFGGIGSAPYKDVSEVRKVGETLLAHKDYLNQQEPNNVFLLTMILGNVDPEYLSEFKRLDEFDKSNLCRAYKFVSYAGTDEATGKTGLELFYDALNKTLATFPDGVGEWAQELVENFPKEEKEGLLRAA